MNAVAPDLAASARQCVELALSTGAHQSEAYCEQSTELEVRVFDGEVESLTDAGRRGIGVRVFDSEGRTGFAYGTDFTPEGLRAICESATANARVTDPDDFAGLPAKCGSAQISGLADPSFSDFSTEQKVEIAKAVDRAARGGDPRISQVEQTVYADGSGRIALANSDGFAGEYESTECFAYSSAFAGTGDQLMTGLGVDVARTPGKLDAEAIGTEAAQRAVQLLGARQTRSRTCQVVLDPFVAASFIGILAGAMSADSVQRGRSLFAGREGETVAAATFELIDDGLHADGHATAPFDGEGVARRRTPLIAGGKLQTFLFDARTARKGGRESTGNARRGSYRGVPGVGATNLVVAGHGVPRDELIGTIDDGLYVTDVVGLHSGVNPISGTFSVGATGIEISAGELAAPVREATIASDLLSMLAGIQVVGADLRWVPFGGSVRTGSLLIDSMTVAGE